MYITHRPPRRGLTIGQLQQRLAGADHGKCFALPQRLVQRAAASGLATAPHGARVGGGSRFAGWGNFAQINRLAKRFSGVAEQLQAQPAAGGQRLGERQKMVVADNIARLPGAGGVAAVQRLAGAKCDRLAGGIKQSQLDPDIFRLPRLGLPPQGDGQRRFGRRRLPVRSQQPQPIDRGSQFRARQTGRGMGRRPHRQRAGIGQRRPAHLPDHAPQQQPGHHHRSQPARPAPPAPHQQQRDGCGRRQQNMPALQGFAGIK